jgi:putative spermidine/putrescine transport system ATP-binding protein
MTSAAEFTGVTQSYGDTVAVENLNLTIEEGKLTTLLGPSGCGKTTTLRMLAGYITPSAGTITINGADATRLPPEKRNLGMVFQSYALFPHLTVADNVGFGLKLRKVPAAERRDTVMRNLDLVGLAHLADRKPKALSGGQQQRVALARAIAIGPSLLLLDEPLSNLDARLRVQMRSEIRRIQSETGLTVVLVTHDQEEALEMSDTMVVMRSGKVMQTGAPADVFTRPANRFVADFLGYENFLTQSDGSLVTVRPEHLRVAGAGRAPAATGLTVSAVVTDSVYRGVDHIVTLVATDASGASVTLVSTTRRDTLSTDDLGLHPGDMVVAQARDHEIVHLAA